MEGIAEPRGQWPARVRLPAAVRLWPVLALLTVVAGRADEQVVPRPFRPATWGIQTAAPQLVRMAAAGVDLLVVDTPLSHQGPELTAADVRLLKQRSRWVACYVSVGQADTNQQYAVGWRPGEPALALARDPEEPAFLEVQFWRAEWRAILVERVLRVLDLGFDGVYLDSAELWKRHLSARPSAREDMVALLEHLAGVARRRRPRSLVLLEDPENLVQEPRVLALADGVSAFAGFIDVNGRPVSEEVRRRNEVWLDRVKAAGGVALTLDFGLTPDTVALTREWASRRGYVWCVTDPGFTGQGLRVR